MSWESILKASKDTPPLEPEKINRNADKTKYPSRTFRKPEVKPLVSRDNKLTYFLASYLDDAQTLKELISEWKESQKILEYKNTNVGLKQLSAVINRIKKYFENIEPVEIDRKQESDEEKTERLVKFFSKLPNPPTASDITTMENNLDILTKFTEKTKLTSKQKDENRVDKVADSILDRDVDIDDLDISDFNAEDLKKLTDYISTYKNRSRMKKLRPNKMKKLREIINEIESKDKDFIGIGHMTNGAILTLPSTFNEDGKDELETLQIITTKNGEKSIDFSKSNAPQFITDLQARQLAGGSTSTSFTLTPLGEVFNINDYSNEELEQGVTNLPSTFLPETISKYYRFVLTRLNKDRDKFLPYMNSSQRNEALTIYGISTQRTSTSSHLPTSLEYLIMEEKLNIENFSQLKTKPESSVHLDKVLSNLYANKYASSNTDLQELFNDTVKGKKAQKKLDDKGSDEKIAVDREDTTKFLTKVKTLGQTSNGTYYYHELIQLSKDEMKGKKDETTKEGNTIPKQIGDLLIKIGTEFKASDVYKSNTQGQVRVRRINNWFNGNKNASVKSLLETTKIPIKDVIDIYKIEDMLTALTNKTAFTITGDIYTIKPAYVQSLKMFLTEKSSASDVMTTFTNYLTSINLDSFNTNDIENLLLDFNKMDATIDAILALCLTLSTLYRDDNFSKVFDNDIEDLTEASDKPAIDNKVREILTKLQTAYSTYRTKFIADSEDKIKEVITKPIMIGTKSKPRSNEPIRFLMTLDEVSNPMEDNI